MLSSRYIIIDYVSFSHPPLTPQLFKALTFLSLFIQTNNYLNQKFDLIFFDDDDTAGYECYKNAIHDLDWTKDCKFSDKTLTFLGVDSFSNALEGLDNLSDLSNRIVVDNSPLPLGGANTELPITAMMSFRTEFEMQYNIKHLTIYCGLACQLLVFIILGQIYLFCKLRRDTNNKRKKLADEYSDSSYSSVTSKLLPKTE